MEAEDSCGEKSVRRRRGKTVFSPGVRCGFVLESIRPMIAAGLLARLSYGAFPSVG